ncbi:MAG: fimbrial protein [Enterobacteriaceae bacterium]
MKKMLMLITSLLFLGWSDTTWSFACQSQGQVIPIGGGTANVHVTLEPKVEIGRNLVVDLSRQIFCHNDYPKTIIDYVTLREGSSYGGALQNFSGSVKYGDRMYAFPTHAETHRLTYTSRQDEPWPTVLYLTPVSSAGGVVISRGSLVAILKLRQRNNINSDDFIFTWNIYANNDVVVPTGGCDISARNITVNLPEYPGSKDIPLSVYCAQNQSLGYYLTGTTADSGRTIFVNTASKLAAQGIGVQLSRSGTVLSTHTTVPMGSVGTTPVNLGLTASYARTGGQVVAGTVQAIIGVTFVYL